MKAPDPVAQPSAIPLTPPGSDTGAPQLRASAAERWVEDYGDYLFAYAFARVRNRARTEDLVQETFLAALRAQSPFAGRSAERTWLTGILRNKIRDYFRTAHREQSFTDLDFYAEEEAEQFTADGFRKGAWIHEMAPDDWSPAAGHSLDQEAFWKTFRNCADKLPLQVARVFILREVDEIETREICQTMNISESNLWVMLHRARMALRRCLESNWFRRGT